MIMVKCMNWKYSLTRQRSVLAAGVVALLLLFSGCTDKEDININLGNPDPDNLCFTSTDITLDGGDNPRIRDIFRAEENICIILQNESTDGDQSNISVTAIILSEDGSKELKRLILDTQGVNISSFCYAGNDCIAGAKSVGGYMIFSLDNGSITCNETDNGRNRMIPSVASASDGFVYVSDNQITKVDPTGQIEASIPFECEIMEIPSRDAYFSKGNAEYVTVTEDMQMVYYSVDFDKQDFTEVAREEDFQLEWPSLYSYGGFAYDQLAGIIYELDPYSRTKAVCSYMKYIMAKPLVGISDSQLYILDKSTYIRGVINVAGDIEIELITPDENILLSDRHELLIKGDKASFDNSLAMAAYLYNSTQDEYYVSIENYYGEEYEYETTAEANRRNLRLMQDFQSGDMPDMLYGNSFDYNYMGNNGLVKDISQYIASSNVIGTDTISDNIYDVMFSDDRCYQVFSGYQLFGLFGDRSLVSGKEDDISLLEDPLLSDTMRQRYTAYDMMSMMLSYPLYKVSDHPELIDESEIEHMLNIAIDIGITPEDQANGNIVFNDNENTILSYIGSYRQFYNMSLARDDVLTYIGFPTVGSCAHMASPSGLVAITEGTEYPDECFAFMEYLLSDEVQQICMIDDYIPVKQSLMDEYYDCLYDPAKVTEDEDVMRYLVATNAPNRSTKLNDAAIIESYINAIESVDGILAFDWGLHGVVAEEVNSYYLMDKSVDSIASSLRQRIMLYLQENSLYGF